MLSAMLLQSCHVLVLAFCVDLARIGPYQVQLPRRVPVHLLGPGRPRALLYRQRSIVLVRCRGPVEGAGVRGIFVQPYGTLHEGDSRGGSWDSWHVYVWPTSHVLSISSPDVAFCPTS